MSQTIWGTIVPSSTSGNQLATILNDFKNAVVSGLSGTSRPTALAAGGGWIDTSLEGASNIWKYKVWTGTVDIEVFTLNLTSGSASIAGSDSIFEISKISADTAAPILKLLKERIANSGQTLVGDVLGEIQFIGADNAAGNPITCRIKSVATDNATVGAAGAALVFEAISTGGTTLAEVMRLVDGKLGIGVTAPEAMVHTKGTTVFKGERVEDTTSGVRSVLKKKRSTGLGQTLNADVIGAHEFSSTTDTGAEATVASIRVEAIENHTDAALGSKIVIGVKKIGEIAITDVATFDATATFPNLSSTVATIATANITTANITTLNATNTNLGTVVETGDASVVLNKGGTQATADAAVSGFAVEMSDATHFKMGYDSTTASKVVAGEVGALKELVNVSSSQTLTNKTLTSPVINTPTGIVKGDVGLGNVDNTSDATKNSASVTLSNKTITLSDIDGGTASDTSRITLPKAAKATLDGLTRKAGTVLFDTDSSKPYYDDGVNLKVIGSGSGGAINFVVDGDAESADIFSAFADAAATSPVDGTGGSGSITGGVTSTSPLSGSKSFLFTKGASNLQGHGRSVAFTIDEANKGRTQEVSFDYVVNSGTFVAGNPSDKTSAGDSSVVVWIYDVTNAVLIQPSNHRLFSNSTTLSSKFRGTFQASSNSTSYRLILFVGRTETTAFELKLDNTSVSPSISPTGPVVTDPVQYTPTFGAGYGTVTNSKIFWTRSGKFMRVFGSTTLGVVAAATGEISLPSGYTIDASYYQATAKNIVGYTRYISSAGGAGYGALSSRLGFDGTTLDKVWLSDASNQDVAGATFNKTNVNSAYGANTSVLNIDFTVAIAGWSSNVQLSSDAGNSQVVFVGTKVAAQAVTANVTKLTYTTVKDSTGSWSSDTYTVPYPGDYTITAGINPAATTGINAYVNGVKGYRLANVTGAAFQVGTIKIPNLRAGDLITLISDTTTTINQSGSEYQLSISRDANPQTVATSDTVAASYWMSATMGSPSAGPFNFDSKEYDTHGSVTTGAGVWKFTAPMPGLYEISSWIDNTTAAAVAAYIHKNGTLYKRIGTLPGASSLATPIGKVRLLQGEYIDLRASGSIALGGGALTGGSNISITRIGNY